MVRSTVAEFRPSKLKDLTTAAFDYQFNALEGTPDTLNEALHNME